MKARLQVLLAATLLSLAFAMTGPAHAATLASCQVDGTLGLIETVGTCNGDAGPGYVEWNLRTEGYTVGSGTVTVSRLSGLFLAEDTCSWNVDRSTSCRGAGGDSSWMSGSGLRLDESGVTQWIQTKIPVRITFQVEGIPSIPFTGKVVFTLSGPSL